MTKEINIKSNLYNYKVSFSEDSAKSLSEIDGSKAYVVDSKVYQLYEKIFSALDKRKIFLMEAIEEKKNMDTVMELLDFFQRTGIRKDWKVVCFGGGITQDVTTIASNLFYRNVDWYFFPTTLLSMSDSCIGGKCGINFGSFKNQIGVFYPPKRIFIDTHFLDTLTDGDYLNGWGEILKFSLTMDDDFFTRLKKEKKYIPCERIADYIYHGLLVKKKVIEEDEFESDIRRVLNYGHTFGHALEAYTKYAIPHGQGVIWGIDVVNYIAFREGLIDKSYYSEIKEVIASSFLKREIIVEEPEKLFALIRTDKKVRGNAVSLAVLDQRSHLIIHPMEIDGKLENYFQEYLRETHEYYSC